MFILLLRNYSVVKVNHMDSMYLNLNSVESYVNYGFCGCIVII